MAVADWDLAAAPPIAFWRVQQPALELVVDCAKQREQFGGTIGHFQAVKHQLADVKKQGYLLQYDRPGASRGFHFLVGEAEASKAVADAVGFHYEMQPDGEYAHAAGIFVITPDGRVARYLYGVEYEPRTLRFALLEASEGRIGSTVDRFILWCHQYNPDEGSYTLFARRVMSIAAFVTVLAIGGGVGFMFLRDRLRGGALPPGASA